MTRAATKVSKRLSSGPQGSKSQRKKADKKSARADVFADHPCATHHLQDFIQGRMRLDELRLQAPELVPPPKPPFPEVIVSSIFETAHFRIEYWLIGGDAVNPTRNGGPILNPGSGSLVGWIDESLGVPDYIQRIAFWLEKSWSVYSSPPISMQVPYTFAIDVKVDRRWPPSLGSSMNITIGLGDDYVASVCAHEVFHLFQYKYNTYGGQFPNEVLLASITEGGADLAVDFVLDALNDYIASEKVLSDPNGWTPHVKRNPNGGGSLPWMAVPIFDVY